MINIRDLENIKSTVSIFDNFKLDKSKPVSFILFSNLIGKEFTFRINLDKYNNVSIDNIFNLSKNDIVDSICYITNFNNKFGDIHTKIETIVIDDISKIAFIVTRYNNKYIILADIDSISDNIICMKVLDIYKSNIVISFEKWKNNNKFIITTILHGLEYKIIIDDRGITILDNDNAAYIIKYLYSALSTLIKPELGKDFIIERIKCDNSQYDLNIVFTIINNIKLSITGKIVSDLDIDEDGYSVVTIDMTVV